MNSESPIDISLRDPLSEVTRKERRMLLGISLLAIFVVNTGLVPSKISALGISLDGADQQAFQLLLALVVAYFLVAFLLYGISDFLAWRISYNESTKINYQKFFNRVLRPKSEQGIEGEKYYPEEWVSKWPNYITHPVSYTRALFEFLLPVLVGGYAIYGLVRAAVQSVA